LAKTVGAEDERKTSESLDHVQPIAVGAREAGPVPPAVDAVFRHLHLGDGSQKALSGEVAALAEARVIRQHPAVSGTRRVLVKFGSGQAPRPTLADPEELAGASPSSPPGTTYGSLPAWATKQNATAALERLAKDAVAADVLKLEGIPGLGLTRSPAETAEAFDGRVRAAVEAEVEKRTSKVRTPLEQRLKSLERHIVEEEAELKRDRSEATRSTAYSLIDVLGSVATAVLGRRRGSIGTAARAGARGYGRIQRSADAIKESEDKIKAWTAERDAVKADIERAEAGERERIEAEAGLREEVRVPVNRADVRALEWYVLWT
jgi:hypothetical protein